MDQAIGNLDNALAKLMSIHEKYDGHAPEHAAMIEQFSQGLIMLQEAMKSFRETIM